MLNNPTGLAGSPAVRHAGRWYLITDAGRFPAPTDVTAELDRYAAALAAADQAVAAPLRQEPPTPTPCPRR